MAIQRSGFTWTGAAAGKKMRAATVRGLGLWAEHVLGVSNERVPLDEATLQRSGVASVDEANLAAAVSYDTAYAVRQHEDMTLRHPNGRQAKYLESAFIENKDLAAKIIANQIRKVTK
jgi:hypothetical protein